MLVKDVGETQGMEVYVDGQDANESDYSYQDGLSVTAPGASLAPAAGQL